MLFIVIFKISTKNKGAVMFDYLRAKPKVHNTVLAMLRVFAERRIALGERLPTVRQLAEEFKVSIYTIHTAISELKKNGIVREMENGITCLIKFPEPESLSQNEPPVTISLLVRDFRDMRKLSSMLVREQSHISFKDQYPQIEIKERQTAATRIDFDTERISRMINGEGPTVGQLSWTIMPVYRNLRLIREIDQEMAGTWLNKLKPDFVQRCKIGNQLFMLPSSWTATCLLYNKEMFRHAGVDPDEGFSSLDNFIAALRRLKAKYGRTPLLFYTGVDLYFWLQHLVAGFNGKWKFGDKLTVTNWREKTALQALECFHQLYCVEGLIGCTELSPDEIRLAILTGQTPLIFDSGHWAGMLMGTGQADKFGMTRIPAPGSRQISMTNISGWIINAMATPEEQQAGLRYALFQEEWLHRKHGGRSRIYFNDFPKPWLIYRNVAIDRFYAANGEMPEEWQQTTERIEHESVWEPFGNDWEKYTHGDRLLAVGRSAAATPALLQQCLTALDDQTIREDEFMPITGITLPA